MASSDQDTAPIEPSKETLETQSKTTSTDVDIKPEERGGDPTYSDDDDDDDGFPKFGAGKARGRLIQPVSGGKGDVTRPLRPVVPAKPVKLNRVEGGNEPSDDS
ncbi:hypothetical protein EST38_g9165 [Candolleomyces aberdarensis]|uniref:Uncharacterized protein n=1 Tax=Candolleomyces aberdarensis TaxID=2316362 RepID=A0A4Q2DBF1_9AGAR|nr:hypothetical protein EST38_g9165 [Candolleomyces aberdarensis]